MPPAVEAKILNRWTTREVLAISSFKKASVREDVGKLGPLSTAAGNVKGAAAMGRFGGSSKNQTCD